MLRKAVAHIQHLEDLLRQNGIQVTAPPATPGVPPTPALTRGDSGSTQGMDADEENEEEEEDETPMRQATGGVATLQVEMKG